MTYADPKIDLDKLRAFKDGVVPKMTGGLGQVSKHAQDHLHPGQGVVRRRDDAQRRARRAAARRTLTFEHAIIATGSRPATVPGPVDRQRRA